MSWELPYSCRVVDCEKEVVRVVGEPESESVAYPYFTDKETLAIVMNARA